MIIKGSKMKLKLHNIFVAIILLCIPILLASTPFQFGDTVGRWQISATTIQGQQAKVIECKTAGMLYVPTSIFNQSATEAAYGSWEGWFYKGADANSINVAFVTDKFNVIDATAAAYSFVVGTTEEIAIYRPGVSILSASAVGYVTNSTWYKWKVTRSLVGSFSFYINDVLVTPTGGYTNPFTDATHTASTYMVFDMDVGDKIGYSTADGGHGLVKKIN